MLIILFLLSVAIANASLLLLAPLGEYNSSPQVFHQEKVLSSPDAMKNLFLDLKIYTGFNCLVNGTTLVCDPPILFDTIEQRGDLDKFVVSQRGFNFNLKFKFRSQKFCQTPQVWNALEYKDNLHGEPMTVFLAELNARGYNCTGNYFTFSCANPIPYDTIKGSCGTSLSYYDPVRCKVDKMYNHSTLNKILPCCYPGADSCKE